MNNYYRPQKPLLESALEQIACRWADNHGVKHLKLNVISRRAFPDRIFFFPGGRPTLIEFKRLGKQPTKLQQFTIDVLRKLGYEVHVVDNIDRLKEVLENALRG